MCELLGDDLAQDHLAELAGGRQWKLGDHFDPLRPLELGQPNAGLMAQAFSRSNTMSVPRYQIVNGEVVQVGGGG